MPQKTHWSDKAFLLIVGHLQVLDSGEGTLASEEEGVGIGELSERVLPTIIAAPLRLRSSRRSDLRGETLINVDEKLVDEAECRRTGSGMCDLLSSSGSCLMGIRETEGVTSCSARRLLEGVLEFESADCGEPGHSPAELPSRGSELPFSRGVTSPMTERHVGVDWSLT